MRKIRISNLLPRCLLIGLLTASSASSAFAQQDPLGEPGKRVKKHIETIMGLEKNAETKYQGTMQKAVQDGSSGNWGGEQGAKKHPWYDQGNPASEIDYMIDSLLMWSYLNVNQYWGCFEPRLIAKGSWMDASDPPRAGPGSQDLMVECMLRCPDLRLFMLPLDNKWEVTEFWRPEYQAYINDYAINRLAPEQQSGKGAGYAPQALRGAKAQSEGIVKQMLAQKYPIDGDMEFPRPYQQVLEVGHEQWGGTPSLPGGNEANQEAHVARTRIGYRTANNKPNSPFGWEVSKDSMFDALGPMTTGPSMFGVGIGGDPQPRDILSLWTEFGQADALVRIPDMTRQLGPLEQQGMDALFGGAQQYSEAARQQNPFWQKQGAMAFRVGRWKDDFGPLQQILKVNPDNNQVLREVVYKGGHELFPLLMNMSGYTTPALSAGLYFARRAFYITGERTLLRFHPDGEKGRIMAYTVNSMDKGREIDKMQLLWPRKGLSPSECYRSQLIPNMVQQTEDGWVKQNFPHDMVQYVDEHKGDITVAYWNKRLVCSCKYLGLYGGSSEMNWPLDLLSGPDPDGNMLGRGSGDRHYGRKEFELCGYAPAMLPSAWASQDQPSCEMMPYNNMQHGLQDGI